MAAGCTRIEYALGKIPFLAYMRDAPSFDPYEAPRPAPPGAVPFDAPVGVVLAPIAATDAAIRTFAAGPDGTNPYPADSAFAALGKLKFDTYCLVCHGPQGKGDGTIVQKDPSEQRYLPLAPDLTRALTVALPDGYIYGIIWVGRGLMPPYGPRTTHRERWAIVNYVRTLQAAAGAAPANPPGRPGN
jgi:mono/diheme cytochrome c family protein